MMKYDVIMEDALNLLINAMVIMIVMIILTKEIALKAIALENFNAKIMNVLI